MAVHLTLVHGGARSPAPFIPSAVVLDERSQRPGELASLMPVVLPPEVATVVSALAASCRLPLPFVAVIAVEAVRALDEVAHAAGVEPSTLAEWLEQATASCVAPEYEPPGARALSAYARAITESITRPTQANELTLVVPDRLRARWSLAAQGDGETVEAWIVTQLAVAPAACVEWEVRAASEGATLAEWLAVQALRRRRSSSTLAQTSA